MSARIEVLHNNYRLPQNGGYAFQSSRREPRDPQTVMLTGSESANFVGFAEIDGATHCAFRSTGAKRCYWFALPIACEEIHPPKPTQPKWRCVANIGDASPLEYGGAFVLVDDNGLYAPELEIIERVEEEIGNRFTVHRFTLERCTFENGILSDNQFHPDFPVWFADDIDAIAKYCGRHVTDIISELCSDDTTTRAIAYRDVANYHGIANFDEYPREIGIEAYSRVTRYQNDIIATQLFKL